MYKLAVFVIETIGDRMAKAAILDVYIWTACCIAGAAVFMAYFFKALWEAIREEIRGF